MTIFEVFDYDHINNSYKNAGRTGLLKASQTLITCISKDYQFVDSNGIVKFNLENISELNGFSPYHGDIDVDKQLEELQTGIDEPGDEDRGDETNDDPFIVKEVLEKRFHGSRNQYEFLVSWIGYTDTTWELANNIPHNKILEFEKRSSIQESRSGRVRKPAVKPDYIKTF